VKKICMILVLVLCLAVVALATDWRVPGDFATIQTAIDGVADGDTILVGPGYFEGAFVTKRVEIKGIEGAIIYDGPAHPHSGIRNLGFQLQVGSDGTTISHFRFEDVGLAIYGIGVNDVSVSQCTFIDSIQAVTNWGGSGWNIDHNKIIDLRTTCGGGIGIFIGGRVGRDGVVEDNVVAHNKISGTLNVSDGDCGGYTGAGIVLYADFRFSDVGAKEIAWNRVIKNKVSLVSDAPAVVDIVAFTLTQGWGSAGHPPDEAIVIHDNAIGFNDFRGTVDQLAFMPVGLEDMNKISRNLGDNRGHGLHPKVFLK